MGFPLKLINRQIVTSEIESFIFEPQTSLTWQAGQYFKYFLNHENPDNRGISRYYTNSNAPHEKNIRIATRFAKEKSSTFKIALKAMQIGQTIEAEGPRGGFIYDNPSQKAVFIAGGIGITPFRSILLDLDYKDLNPDITLLYANRSPEIAFKSVFDDLTQKHNNLKVIYTVDTPTPEWTGEVGKIDENFIKKHVSDYLSPDLIYYVSGPEPMVEAFGKMLEGMGIPKEKFKQDFFPGYDEKL